MILKRIFGLKWDANGEWRRLYNENLLILYRSPNKGRVIKYKTLRWAGHVSRMEESESAFKIAIYINLQERDLKETVMITRNW